MHRRLSAVKNLLLLGTAFVLNFTSYQGLAALQSSVNTSGGLGTAGLAVTYASVVVSSLAVSPLAIGRLGPKRTMAVGLLGYLAYCCLNVYPTWATIIPGSAIVGVFAAPLWAGSGVYILRLAAEYSGSDSAARDKTAAVFFAAFFTMVTSCNIWGNLISYLALTDTSPTNGTRVQNLTCGYKFCSADAGGSAAERPEMVKFYVMLGCFAAASCLSILVMTLLVRRYDDESDRQRVSLATLKKNLVAMATHMRDSRQLLLIPITVNVGLSQSFAFGEFTEGFVACSSGIPAVGRVMMLYGTSQVVCSLPAGAAAARVGKLPILLLAAAVQLSLECLSLFWQVSPEPAWLLFGFAAAMGLVDIVWNSQMIALYGQYFADNQDAAFSAYRFFESVGYIIGFSYNKLLCIEQKLFVMMSFVVVGAVGLILSNFAGRRNGSVN